MNVGQVPRIDKSHHSEKDQGSYSYLQCKSNIADQEWEHYNPKRQEKYHQALPIETKYPTNKEEGKISILFMEKVIGGKKQVDDGQTVGSKARPSVESCKNIFRIGRCCKHVQRIENRRNIDQEKDN